MPNPFVRKLDALGPLSDRDKKLLQQAVVATRWVDANHDLVRKGECLSGCKLILQGVACGYRILEDGQRQITSFKLPGDLCGLGGFLIGKADHSVGTLAPCMVVAVPPETLANWVKSQPGIARALWRGTLVDAAVSQTWLCNLGRRTARERIAHLLCEVLLRLEAVGPAEGAPVVLPFMQAEIGDALGLPIVHVTRTLQQLRAERLIEIDGGQVAILDRDSLQAAGNFDPAYLQPHPASLGIDGARRPA